MVRKVTTALFLSIALHAEPYEIGRGIQLDEALKVGGYFSTEYEVLKDEEHAAIDDVAVLAYGDISPMFSYLAELESVGFYRKNLSTGEENNSQKFHIERLYGDAWFSDMLNVRFGKQLTPIGYWNREPINVLRDTTSNPLYIMLLFPRFLTGIDINGYVPGSEGLRYHLFGQKNHDLDEEYINIPNTHFFGLSFDKEISNDWSAGGSVGEYIALSTSEKTRFVQANAKYDNGRWGVMGEGIVAKTDYNGARSDETIAAYVQGIYRFTPQHAAVGRVEYFDRQYDDYTDRIGIVGYSYRPIYPVSLKGEYQWHSQSDENRFLCSFSVLF